ncbi:hypothetical protein KFK09_019618 [Dendrobium nobile]|uniref:Uncharacterized protein n=1 Tax=Dendrobium nobile TaxID=94219 RepID=A0A8T3APZ8_DENNO|nr:hypothetical protein KFK09_019618 [Dendrobium nobile]
MLGFSFPGTISGSKKLRIWDLSLRTISGPVCTPDLSKILQNANKRKIRPHGFGGFTGSARQSARKRRKIVTSVLPSNPTGDKNNVVVEEGDEAFFSNSIQTPGSGEAPDAEAVKKARGPNKIRG